MLTLSRSDIETLVDLDHASQAIETAYIAASAGRATIPPVGYLAFPEAEGDCHIKYGYIAGDPVFVVKVATGFYGNPAKGLATSNGLMLAMSATTGELQAVLFDEGLLTDLRTGLGGAIATRALCRADAHRVAIIGTGIQARMQIRCLRRLMADRPLRFTVWGRSASAADDVARDLADEDIVVEVARDLEHLCGNADIIITTTPARQPLIQNDWIGPGTHITAVGADAPGKQELDVALVARADLRVADLLDQSLAHGEFSTAFRASLVARRDFRELGAVLGGTAKGRGSVSDITVADLTGTAVQDIAIVRSVLEAHRRHEASGIR